MRSLFKIIKFLSIPLLSLGLVTSFSLVTLGVIKNPLKKKSNDQFNVFQEIDKLKRRVASVNQQIETIDHEIPKGTETTAAAIADVNPVEEKMGEMVMVSGSTVRSLLEAKCYFDEMKKTVGSSQVKFDFLDCLPKDTRMKLFNRTNGYEAQIFPSRGKKVSSDFVQLQHGENELVLEISSTPGQIKSQIIKINRIK